MFSIPAGSSLREALDALASSSGLTVLYAPELVAGKSTPGLSGRHAPADALRQLLQGSGLEAQDVGDATYTLKRVSASVPGRGSQGATRSTPATAPPAVAEPTDLGRTTITGSRIRGGTTPSPVLTIGSERIQEEGFTDLGEVIRSLPQNFSGGQNPGVVNGTAAGNANQDLTGGSAFNLRGLGPDATLTLINGRRPSYGSAVQVVDVSAIPIEAVEYIQIVPDGASAIYGSDAVGGVGNVVLKRDFDGVAVGARYGAATNGGLDTREYSVTAGTAWSSGGVIAAWKRSLNDPVYSHQREYTQDMYAPTAIYPKSELQSGLLSAHQTLGSGTEFRIDAIRTKREMLREIAQATVYYPYAAETTATLLSPSIELPLRNDWTLVIGGAWGEDETTFRQPAITTATGAVTSQSRGYYANTSRSYDVGVEGPLFILPGGEVRLAAGAGKRTSDFEYVGGNQTSTMTYADGEQSSRFAYVEINLPLIAPGQGVRGAHRLAFTGAARGEDSDSFGSVTTPKLGLIYSPSADVTLKASWGKSFKAPTLLQQYQLQPVYLYAASAAGGSGYPPDATVLWHGAGGNPDLAPERARTWSASLALHPEALPGLETELTWFDIDYTDRVMLPFTALTQALSNPALSEFVTYAPSAQQQSALLDTAATFTNLVGVPYDAANVVAIIHNVYTNATRQRIRGIDLSGSYRFDLGPGRLTLRGSSSWLDSSRQLTAGQPSQDLAGNLFYPAKVNARAGAVWSHGGLSLSAFANHTGGLVDTATGRKGGSFNTADAVLRYITEDGGQWLSGLTFELSAQNLFDREPPRYAVLPVTAAPYDSTNYSAIGRFMSVSVSKRW